MQKMKSRKGFTLIEMLIVVGIIAILVAVSIPMVNSSLERAKVATDAANERAAKAAAMIQYLAGDSTDAVVNASDGSINGVYDAEAGKIIKTEPDNGYGKCKDHKNEILQVSVDADGLVKMAWITKGAAPGEALGGDGGDIHGIIVDAASTPAPG